jgi:hypothetical protein
MNAEEIIKTIYLGDRACKKILVDAWNNRFCLQVSVISRLKEGTDTWNYYSDEDVENGWLVFTDCSYISLKPDGFIPNDYIDGIDVRKDGEKYIFEIFVGSGSETGQITDVLIEVRAGGIIIESNDALLQKFSE